MLEISELESIYQGLHATIIGRYVNAASFFVNEDKETSFDRIDIDVHIGRRRVYYLFRTGRHIVIGLINRNVSFLVFEITPQSQLFISVPDKSPHYQNTRCLVDLRSFHLLYNHDDIDDVPIEYFFDKVQLRAFLDTFKYGKDFLDFKSYKDFKAYVDRSISAYESVGAILLDEHVIFGLGPYTLSEAFSKANVPPDTHPSKIDSVQWENIFNSIKEVITLSLSKRGASLPTTKYVDAFGNPGTYQNELKVYGKTSHQFMGIFY